MEFLSLDDRRVMRCDPPGDVRAFARRNASRTAHTHFCTGDIAPGASACACRHTRLLAPGPVAHTRAHMAGKGDIRAAEGDPDEDPTQHAASSQPDDSHNRSPEQAPQRRLPNRPSTAKFNSNTPMRPTSQVQRRLPVIQTIAQTQRVGQPVVQDIPQPPPVSRRLVFAPARAAVVLPPPPAPPAAALLLDRLGFVAANLQIQMITHNKHPAACAAHVFAGRLDTLVSGVRQRHDDDDQPMLDMNATWDGVEWASADDFDAWFIDSLAPRGRYALTHALFHLQQTRCLSGLHLLDIVQSRELSLRFLKLVRLGGSAADTVDWRAENVWWAERRTLGETLVGHTFGWLPSQPPDKHTRVQTLLLDLTAAVRSRVPLDAWMALRLDTVCADLGASAAACLAKAHSRAQVLHILVLEWRHAKDKRARAELAHTMQWMRDFLARGCDCKH